MNGINCLEELVIQIIKFYGQCVNVSEITNGGLTCETKMIADSFCKYFSTIANSLKFKSIHLRYFVWGKVPKEINKCGTFFKFHRVNDVDV